MTVAVGRLLPEPLLNRPVNQESGVLRRAEDFDAIEYSCPERMKGEMVALFAAQGRSGMQYRDNRSARE